MKSYINPLWFYLIDITDSLDIMILIISIILLFIIIYCGFDKFMYDDVTYSWNKLKKLIIFFIITTIISIFIPNKTTMKEMLIVSYITEDDIVSATNYGKDLVDYIFEKVEDTNKQENEGK